MLNFIIVLLVALFILLNARRKIKRKGIIYYNRMLAEDKLTSQAIAEFNLSKKEILNSENSAIEINKFITQLQLDKAEEKKSMDKILRDSFLMFIHGSEVLSANYAESRYQIDVINRKLEMSYNLRHRINTDNGLKDT